MTKMLQLPFKQKPNEKTKPTVGIVHTYIHIYIRSGQYMCTNIIKKLLLYLPSTTRHFEYIIEDVVAKKKSTANQKAIYKRAYKKAILDLVAKKHANYGNMIAYNAYTDTIAKLREIGMTVNPAALRMAVHWSYRSMREVSISLSVSTSSTLLSSLPSESTNNDNATGLNGRDIVWQS